MKTFDIVAAVLVVVGTVNYGLSGAFQAIQWKASQRRWFGSVAFASA
jgi:hypothetical protein